MGFDMQDSTELENWMIQTFAFAIISNGCELNASAGQTMLKEEVIGKLAAQPEGGFAYRGVVAAAVKHAASLIDDVSESNSSPVTRENIETVNVWMLKTLAAINIALRKPFDHDQLMAEAHTIIARVQGNKRKLPTRADLDYLIRGTIAYAAEQLKV